MYMGLLYNSLLWVLLLLFGFWTDDSADDAADDGGYQCQQVEEGQYDYEQGDDGDGEDAGDLADLTFSEASNTIDEGGQDEPVDGGGAIDIPFGEEWLIPRIDQSEMPGWEQVSGGAIKQYK